MSFFRFVPSHDAAPLVYVYHEQGAPSPLQPRDYSLFKEISLPPGTSSKVIPEQLALARTAIGDWTREQREKPFGQVIGCEFAVSNQLSIFLDQEGQFSRRASFAEAAHTHNDALVDPTYVVGHAEEGFCSLLSFVEGEAADDQDLFYARRFALLLEATAAADEHAASVFRIVQENDVLRELKVDLGLVEAMPFPRSYQVAEWFLAGPTFLAGEAEQTHCNLSALARVDVTSILSLIDPEELTTITQAIASFSHANNAQGFTQSIFALRDGYAPSRARMRLILNVIDATYLEGQITYLHCFGGRGRSGTVVGCWLNRHGITTADEALARTAELRFAAGLFQGESPETAAQRRLVREWDEGE